MNKKKTFEIFAIGLAFLLGESGQVFAAKKAFLEVIEGRVQILRAKETSWAPAGVTVTPEAQIVLGPGDRVRTSNKAKARILLDDGSKIDIAPSSIVLIDFLEENNFRFRLNLGRLKALVSKITNRRFAIVTPSAVCAVRGTEFDVAVNKDQATSVSVAEGLVAISDQKGNELLLKAGEAIFVTLEGLEGAKPQGEGQTTKADEQTKAEVAREVSLNMSRDAIEAAAAIEMKNSVAQDGKTLIDAFGQRVRTESYIARNDAENKVSWVVLNTRDDSFNYGRFDAWANTTLPETLGSNFFSRLYFNWGDTQPGIWALKDQWFMSNTKDWWIKANTGGNPVWFESVFPENPRWWETIFDNSYVVVSEGGDARLLEHYQPALGVKTWLAGPRTSALVPGITEEGNAPTYFYDYYESADAGSIIGDNAGIPDEQLQTLASVDVDAINTAFAAREGYYNNWRYYLDGQFISGADGNTSSTFEWNSLNTKIHETIQNQYGTASVNADGTPTGFTQSQAGNGRNLIVTYDDYLINDDGQILTFANMAQTVTGSDAQAAFKQFAEKTNFEFVTLSPTYASKIDLVMPMRLLNAMGADDDRPADLY